MKAFVTKYALTTGIDEVDAEVCAGGVNVNGGNMIKVAHDPENPHRWSYYFKPDWHTTREEAVDRAVAMRAAKIASHRKSITRLEKLRFT